MHILTLTHEVWEEDGVEHEEFDYEIEHADDCEVKPIYQAPFGPIIDYFCPVGDEIAAVGLESLSWKDEIAEYDPKLQAWEQWHAIPPGRYEIEYWGETWMGEWDGGLRIIRRLTKES